MYQSEDCRGVFYVSSSRTDLLTQKSVQLRKEFNFQRIGLGHCHGFRDFMWKHSISLWNKYSLFYGWKKKQKIYTDKFPTSLLPYFTIFLTWRIFPSHNYYSFLFSINSPPSSLYLEGKRKRGFVTSGYKTDDEASDDGELPCSKGVEVLFPFKYLYSFSIFSLF